MAAALRKEMLLGRYVVDEGIVGETHLKAVAGETTALLYQSVPGGSCVVASEAFEFSTEGGAPEGIQKDLHAG